MTNTETVSKGKSKVQKFAIKFGIFAVVIIIVFLLGFIPMWMNARTAAAEHEVTKKLLVKEQITNSLTKGIIDARRGEYETARQDASDFFSNLSKELDKGEASAYSEGQINNLKAVFENRDAMITLLAQRDQASVERLTDIYLEYQKAVGDTRPALEKKEPESKLEPSEDANSNANDSNAM